MTNSEKIERRATELYYQLSPLSAVTLWLNAPIAVKSTFHRMAIDELCPPVTITYTVDPETITFSEWQNGEEVGTGDAADIDLLRETGELDPALAALWDAMVSDLSFDDAA